MSDRLGVDDRLQVEHAKSERLPQRSAERAARERLEDDLLQDAHGRPQQVPSHEPMFGSGDGPVQVDRRVSVHGGDRPVQGDDLVRDHQFIRLVLRPIPVAEGRRPKHPDPEEDRAGPNSLLPGKSGQCLEQILSVVQAEDPLGAILNALHRVGLASPSPVTGRYGFPPPPIDDELSMSGCSRSSSDPLEAGSVVRRIADGGRAVIALSGGVDSAVVAALAFEALGAEATAVTLRGPAVARAEVDRAVHVAREIGITHRLLTVDPLERAEYRANPTNRCYFCRSVEAGRLLSFGKEWGARQYLDGIHADDYSDDRPGLLAMDEAGFRHPLAEEGWTKADVRHAARSRHLGNAEQPSDACLASRVAHGNPIDAPLLARIEAAETILLERGFRRVRVRVRGEDARIEVDPSEVSRLSTAPLCSEILSSVRNLGFGSVVIDPNGYGRRGAGTGVAP